MEIAKAVGQPVRIDKATLDKSNGQYARVLVELDYNNDLTTDIEIVRSGFSFWVKVFYEYLPELCNNCLSIGHKVDSCRRKKLVREADSDGPSGTVNRVVFPLRGNRKRRKEGESLLVNEAVQVQNSENLNKHDKVEFTGIVETVEVQVQNSEILNEQDKVEVTGIVAKAVESKNEEAFHQAGTGHEVLNLQFQDVDDEARRVSSLVGAPVDKEVESPVGVSFVSAELNVSPPTYAQVLSANHFELLQEQQINDCISLDVISKQNNIKIPSTKEVWNTVQKAQQQMEKDLQIIRNPPGEEVEEVEHDLDGFTQAKSRSLKKINNKFKSLRRKVVFSGGKQTHSYSLRGVSN